MRQKSFGLEWLDRNSLKQQEWARQYLQRGGHILQRFASSTHEDLLLVGERLERSRDDRATIQRMRNAWRQVEYRAPNKGRKAYTFKLKAETKKELARLARKNDTNETDMLCKLIADGVAANTRLSKQLKDTNETIRKMKELYTEEKRRLTGTSNDLMAYFELSAQLLCRDEVLLKGASISTGIITEDQQHDMEKLRKLIMKETKSALAGAMDLAPTGFLELAMREESSARRLAARSMTTTD